MRLIRATWCWMRLGSLAERLRADNRGVSLIEFALVMPVMLTLTLYGTEVARLAITSMQVSQMALSVADNASRLGQTDNSGVTPTIAESDIDSVMFGALEQGEAIDFEANGRIILSSLEQDPDNGDQYIHWQRCRGDLDAESNYGEETPDGAEDGGLPGMGQPETVTARANSAVMFVEVEYRYEPIFNLFLSGGRTIRQEAAFVVRDDRSLAPGVSPDGVAESIC